MSGGGPGHHLDDEAGDASGGGARRIDLVDTGARDFTVLGWGLAAAVTVATVAIWLSLGGSVSSRRGKVIGIVVLAGGFVAFWVVAWGLGRLGFVAVRRVSPQAEDSGRPIATPAGLVDPGRCLALRDRGTAMGLILGLVLCAGMAFGLAIVSIRNGFPWIAFSGLIPLTPVWWVVRRIRANVSGLVLGDASLVRDWRGRWSVLDEDALATLEVESDGDSGGELRLQVDGRPRAMVLSLRELRGVADWLDIDVLGNDDGDDVGDDDDHA